MWVRYRNESGDIVIECFDRIICHREAGGKQIIFGRVRGYSDVQLFETVHPSDCQRLMSMFVNHKQDVVTMPGAERVQGLKDYE